MKKRFAILSIIMCFVLCLLTSCGVGFKVMGVAGVSNPIIDPSHNNISFQVENSVETFDIDDIEVSINSGSITSKAYLDEELSTEANDLLKLNQGLNRFYIKFSLVGENGSSKSTVWTLDINRLFPFKPIKEISILEFKDEYRKNDSFIPGKLKVSYQDGTEGVVPISLDMLEGFDTKKLGDKDIVITFMNEKIIKTIRVLPLEDSELSKIKILDMDSTYYLKQEFTGGRLRCYYGRDTMDIDITKDMVPEFNTQTPGNKIARVKFGGLEEEFSYEVLNILETASLYSYTTTYEQNSEFDGGLLKLTRGDKVEFKEITLDMVTNFDTRSLGRKTIVVNYGANRFAYDINVIEKITNSPNLSVGSLDTYQARSLMQSFIALFKVKSSNETSNDFQRHKNEAYEDIKNADLEECRSYLNKAGIGKDDLYELSTYIENDLFIVTKIVKKVEENQGKLINVLTYDDVNIIKNTLLKAINLLEINQYAMLIPANIKEAYNDYSYYIFNENEEDKVEANLTKIGEMINNDDVKAFFNKQITTNLGYKERAYFVAFTKDLLKTLTSIDTKLIYDLTQIDYENILATLPTMLNTIRRVGDELIKLLDKDSTYRMLNVAIKEYMGLSHEYRTSGGLLIDYVPEAVSKGRIYLMDIAKILSTFTMTDLDSLTNVISYMMNEENDANSKENYAVGAINLAKRLNPIVNKMEDNGDGWLLDAIFRGETEETQFSKGFIFELNKLAKYNIDNLNPIIINNIIEEINNALNEEGSAAGHISGDSIVVAKGSTVEEFIKAFNKYNLIHSYALNMNLTLSEKMFINLKEFKESLNTAGLHKTRIAIGDNTIQMNYVVLDKNMTITPHFDYSNNDLNLFYINTAGEILKIKNRYDLEYNEDSFISYDEFVRDKHFSFYVDDLKLELRLSYARLTNERSIVFNMTDEPALGALQLINSLGTYYIPIHYVVVSNNPSVDYTRSNDYYVKNIRNDVYFEIDYGFARINLNNMKDSFEAMQVGRHELDYNYNGNIIKLAINIVNEDMQNKPVDIIRSSGKIYANDHDTFKNLYLLVKKPIEKQFMRYDELISLLNKYYSSVSSYIKNVNQKKYLVFSFYDPSSYSYKELSVQVKEMTLAEYRRLNIKYNANSLNLELDDYEFNNYKSYKSDYELENIFIERLKNANLKIYSYGYSYNGEELIPWLNRVGISYHYEIERNDDYIKLSLITDYEGKINFIIVRRDYNRKTVSHDRITSKNDFVYIEEDMLYKPNLMESLLLEQLQLEINYQYTNDSISGEELLSYLKERNYKFSPERISNNQIVGEIILDNDERIKLDIGVEIPDAKPIEINNLYYTKYNFSSNLNIQGLIKKGFLEVNGIELDSTGRVLNVKIESRTSSFRITFDYNIYSCTFKFALNVSYLSYTPNNLVFIKPKNMRVEEMTRSEIISNLFAKYYDNLVLDANLENGLSSFNIEAHSNYLYLSNYYTSFQVLF